MSKVLRVILTFLLFIYKSEANEENELYIIGGRKAIPGQFPYVALMEISFIKENGSEIIRVCTATILNSKWVITAAHCYRENSHLILYVGTVDRKQTRESYEIEDFITHEGFYSQDEVDLALVKVRGNIIFNDRVQKIDLTDSESPSGTKALAIGFGLERVESLRVLRSRYLNFIYAEVLSYDECSKSVRHVEQKQICALTTANSGVCNGDSGGPLIANNKIIGVAVAIGHPYICATQYPDTYTDIYQHLDWIKKHMED